MAYSKRVLIFTASFGGAQRGAAEAIADYYRVQYPDAVDITVVDFFEEFAPSLNVLAKFAYQQSDEFFPSGYGTFLEMLDRLPANPVLNEFHQTGLERARAFVEDCGPDAIISTFSVAGGVVADLDTRWPFVKATVVPDFDTRMSWLHPATDLHFVACKEAREDLVVCGIQWDKVVVSGVPIHPRFTSDLVRSESRKGLGLADRFTVVLAEAAGAPGEAKDLARRLVGAGIQVAAIAGRNGRLAERLRTLEKDTDLFKVFGFVEHMNRVLNSADVLVGKVGGLVISEALAMHVPVIIQSPIPGQEVHNVDFLVNYGAGLLSRDEEDVVEKVRFVSTHPERIEQMNERAGQLGRPSATQVVCERVRAAMM